MINEIPRIFNSISDDELFNVLREMQEDDLKGIIRENGLFRKYVRLMCDITGTDTSSAIFPVTINIYKEAANRRTTYIISKPDPREDD